MAVITITIPDDIKHRLEEVDNKSGLITRLLTEYFSSDYESIEVLEAKIQEIEKEHKERITKIQEKIFIKKQEREQELENERRKEKLRKMREESPILDLK